MTKLTVAAVQAAYVLMDRGATLAKVEELLADPAVQAADLVVFPEAFVPGTPIWIDGPPIWDGDEQWFAMLADQAVVVPSEATDRLGAAARQAGVYLVIGINEREAAGSTIYNTLLYFDANGNLLGKTYHAGVAGSSNRPGPALLVTLVTGAMNPWAPATTK
ncbi:nitrilase-related carbon-nitrogen hydrolase [Kribbella sp. NPDC026596]|uniref:nitrilase-related carbon-nitrogen hydrolase n=1 Tax=Kribbella sp. NPDC026596 TaxID=3155122 RepID=UPI0033CAFB93